MFVNVIQILSHNNIIASATYKMTMKIQPWFLYYVMYFCSSYGSLLIGYLQTVKLANCCWEIAAYFVSSLSLLCINFVLIEGRENGKPTGTAVLKSLWKDLDTVIGRLK